MIMCVCNNLSTEVMVEKIREGVPLEEVHESLGCDMMCGSCVKFIQEKYDLVMYGKD